MELTGNLGGNNGHKWARMPMAFNFDSNNSEYGAAWYTQMSPDPCISGKARKTFISALSNATKNWFAKLKHSAQWSSGSNIIEGILPFSSSNESNCSFVKTLPLMYSSSDIILSCCDLATDEFSVSIEDSNLISPNNPIINKINPTPSATFIQWRWISFPVSRVPFWNQKQTRRKIFLSNNISSNATPIITMAEEIVNPKYKESRVIDCILSAECGRRLIERNYDFVFKAALVHRLKQKIQQAVAVV